MKAIKRILNGVAGVITYFANIVGLMFAIWLFAESDYLVSKIVIGVFAAIIFVLNYFGGDVNQPEK